ncbi:SDR family NAD(P)-dependent oxidoreductase [Massilia niabensis]|uniref:SDR family NAD(P)-dependent oxidoreductase n=1 Tax=Massilia niabensis TaxID=544910 RepID=A0ABW0LD77_9BURK
MSLKLAQKVAVVTGGSTGIGLAIARRFVSEGAKVYITGRRQAELDAAVQAIGDGVESARVDSSDIAQLQALFEQINQKHGKLDVLVANAGGGSLLPLGQITEEHFDDTFSRNVKGTLFTVQTALPLLGKGSSVILTGSTAASGGTESFSVYAASKAAVRAFARNWIIDLKGRGIRVNTLSPGPIKTSGLVELVGSDPGQQQGFLDHLASLIPMGRVGEPDEIAKAAVFLASDDASFVSGIELFVDGGMRQI